jgi:hypothetical protein
MFVCYLPSYFTETPCRVSQVLCIQDNIRVNIVLVPFHLVQIQINKLDTFD